MIELLLSVVTLVPAPREFKAMEGGCRQEIVLPCPRYDWVDFDLKGACLAKVKCAESRDANLPPEGYRLKVSPDGS